MFYNIVGNANKFTENGVIKIDASSTKLSEFETELSVMVSDNGIGIAKEDLSHIFESHYQGAVSENVSDIGIGLGLNICREIVRLFDGNIRVESEVRKGTTVTFNLVLALV